MVQVVTICHQMVSTLRFQVILRRRNLILIREGTFFLGGGGRAGASEGRVISESEHQKGRAIPHVSYSREGHTSFPKFFNENFCDVSFQFSYRLSFLFTYFDLIWCFIIGSRLHFYTYIMPLHIFFLRGLVSFSVRIEKCLTQVSFLQLLAVGFPLPDLLSRLVLKSY